MSSATANDADPTAAKLQRRARRLRTQAASLGPVLADAYSRRAAELDVQAWLEAVWNPPIDLRDTVPTDESDDVVARPTPTRHLTIA